MQNNGVGAPDPQTQPAPQPAGQPGAQAAVYRAPGQPLGMVNAPINNAANAAGQPGSYSPTVSYQPQVDLEPMTEPDTPAPPVAPAPWPGQTGQAGSASPFAPAGQRPPIYQPSGATPYAPQIPAAPLVIAPAQPPAVIAPPAQPPAWQPQRQIARSAPAPARQQVARAHAASAPAQPVRAAPRTQPQPGRRARWLPLPHTLLILSVGLMLLATRLPWGVDSSGNIIMLQTASVPGLSTQGGDGSALQIANNLLGAVAILSLGLLIFNGLLRGIYRVLGGGCFSFVAMLPLYPILVALIVLLLGADIIAAGFGGLGPLAQAPGAQTYGMAGLELANYKLGYLAWYTGIMLNVAGLLGEFVVSGRRRR